MLLLDFNCHFMLVMFSLLPNKLPYGTTKRVLPCTHAHNHTIKYPHRFLQKSTTECKSSFAGLFPVGVVRAFQHMTFWEEKFPYFLLDDGE